MLFLKLNLLEKKETLKKLGAELIEVDAVPYSNPKNYIKQSKQIAEDLNKTSSMEFIGLISLIILLIQKHIFKQQQKKFGTKQQVQLMDLPVL